MSYQLNTGQSEDIGWQMVEFTDAQRRTLALLFRQRDFWWNSFDRRRSYEWKMAFALWAALLSFGAFLLGVSDKLTALGIGWKIIVTIILGAVAILHTFWIFNLTRANWRDKEQAFTYAEAIRRTLGLQYAAELSKDISEVKGRGAWKIMKRWNESFHASVTVLLAVIVAIALWNI